MDNFNPKDYLWSFPRGIGQNDWDWKSMLTRDVRCCIKYYIPDYDIEDFTLERLEKMGIENFHKLALTLLAQYPGWFRKDMTVFNFIDLLGKFMEEDSPLRDKELLDLYKE